jgi:hypothetical protein
VFVGEEISQSSNELWCRRQGLDSRRRYNTTVSKIVSRCKQFSIRFYCEAGFSAVKTVNLWVCPLSRLTLPPSEILKMPSWNFFKFGTCITSLLQRLVTIPLQADTVHIRGRNLNRPPHRNAFLTYLLSIMFSNVHVFVLCTTLESL